MDYRTAGVDIDKGDRLVSRIKEMLGASGVQIGHFGGALPLPVDSYREPILVSSIDSVGTKVKIAVATGQHDTIGVDLVHHSINDIACCGAEPLGFMDYIAMGTLDEEVASRAIAGIIKACKEWNVQLTGGETAEMPGIYLPGEYDLVGTICGIVEKSEFIDGSNICAGDVLIGFPSNGLHTNGYSLARKILDPIGYDVTLPELNGTIGSALLAEHRCYLDEIRQLKNRTVIKGLAHITGGGLMGNVSRIIPQNLSVNIEWGSWQEPPIFDVIRKEGQVPEDDMRRTFNLGVGLTAVLTQADAEQVISNFPEDLHRPFAIGVVHQAEFEITREDHSF